MANTPENLLSTINSIENYRELFAEAFPERDQKEMITLKEIVTSIVAFETTLVSLNSKYDQYAHGYHQALNEKTHHNIIGADLAGGMQERGRHLLSRSHSPSLPVGLNILHRHGPLLPALPRFLQRRLQG